MNKRKRNLIALLSVMLLLVIALCACMTQNQQNEAETTAPVTTDPGFGFETWGNIPSTGLSGDTEQPIQNESFEEEEPSQSTQPTETESTQATTAPNPYTPGSLSYEEYLALDGAQQQLYAMSFDSVESYINWYNAALEEYENGDVVEITGPVDLEDYS